MYDHIHEAFCYTLSLLWIVQDLAASWDDYTTPADQPPTPRPLPDSDTDSDSGLPESPMSEYSEPPMADHTMPQPGTPQAAAGESLAKRWGRWVRKKVKKGKLLAAYLVKELGDQITNARYASLLVRFRQQAGSAQHVFHIRPMHTTDRCFYRSRILTMQYCNSYTAALNCIQSFLLYVYIHAVAFNCRVHLI